MGTLEQIEKTGLDELQNVQNEDDLQLWKVRHLGRNSALMLTFDQLGSLPKEERPLIGRRANEAKRQLEAAFEQRSQLLHQEAVERALSAERLDVTLPGRSMPHGHVPPAKKSMREVSAVFAEMGFQVYRSREVELDEYNFQLLNFPPNHPARDMQDSFYVETGDNLGENPVLMRTHTSPGQIRAMREMAARNPGDPPPLAPGRSAGAALRRPAHRDNAHRRLPPG